jgi:hypothetical protein
MKVSHLTVTMTGFVLAAALAGCGDDGGSAKTAADPTPSTTTADTSPSAPLGYSLLRDGSEGIPLEAGPYGLIPAGSPVKNVAVIQAPAGYENYGGWTFVTHEGDGPFRALGILTVDSVFGDPCGSKGHSKTDTLKNPGPTVKDLARALTEQKGTTTSKPAPVMLDGYHGLHLDYQIAKGVDVAKCEAKAFDILTMAPNDDAGWWIDASRERAGIWILDVDGERVLMSWVAWPGTTKAHIKELNAMAKSTKFEPLVS